MDAIEREDVDFEDLLDLLLFTYFFRWRRRRIPRIDYLTPIDSLVPVLASIQDILRSENRFRCIDRFRMSGNQFQMLCGLIENSQSIQVSNRLPLILQVAIFLDFIRWSPWSS